MIRLIILIHFATLPLFTFSQTFWGLQNGRSPGIFNLNLQPASSVGQHPNVDIKLVGLSARLHNNFIGIQTASLYDKSFLQVNEQTYKNILPARYNGRNKSLFAHQDADLPGISLRLTPKHSISLTGRLRTFFNIDGLREPGARFAYEGLDVPDQFGIQYDNSGLSIGLLSYAEFALGYAQQIYENGPHRLNAGGRIKLLLGLASGNLYMRSLDYAFNSQTQLDIYNIETSAQLGLMADSLTAGFNPLQDLRNLNFNNLGVGGDLGLVYEYRPEPDMYLFKLGLSVLDIGNIPFNQTNRQYAFSGMLTGFDLDDVQGANFDDIDSTLQAEFSYSSDSASFRVSLPSAVSLQADLRISKHFYVSVIPFINIRPKNSEKGAHHFTGIYVAPRFEGKFWGVSLPVSAVANRGPALGMNVRLGPIILGTSDFISPLFSQEIRGMDLQIGLRAPITIQKKKDSDFDGVPDKKDACPDVPGLVTLNGCPELDTNQETITQKEEKDKPEEIIKKDDKKDSVPPKNNNQSSSINPSENNQQEEPKPIVEEEEQKFDVVPVPKFPPHDDLGGKKEPFEKIYFQSASFALDGQARYSLNYVYEYLRDHPGSYMKIMGHADQIGPEDYNDNLSRRRAEAVRRYLTSRGIQPQRLTVEYYGETQPLDSDSADDRQNRRVELILFDF
ncbi:MAG: OmpA family protein [Bacteroidetes bacterium]|nr:OmpA family protein [Bacteroidota bacterium]